MRILFISQDFYPDSVAVSLFVSDLAFHLAKNGHEIEVITSRYQYELPLVKYPLNEIVNGIKIRRIRHTKFGKKLILGRLFDFTSFTLNISLHYLFRKNTSYDLVIGNSSPPILYLFSALISRLKGNPFCLWLMDFQPELSIAAGLIKEEALSAKILSYGGKIARRNTQLIFTLDHFMKENLLKMGVNHSKIKVNPLWSTLLEKNTFSRESNPFRKKHQFQDKTILMYSGNHAYVHPLNTVLETALELKNSEEFMFVFIGEGVRKKDIENFKFQHGLTNILSLPFQDRENFHISLGAADLQIVILGEGQVGHTHPNKIYGALASGKPILYIGPSPSHVTELLEGLTGNIILNHGESQKLVKELRKFRENQFSILSKTEDQNIRFIQKNFHKDELLDIMKKEIESFNP